MALPAAPAAAHDGEGVITHADTRAELALVDVAGTAEAAAAPGALPYGWCGDERVTDDTAHAALPPTSARFKLIYAHPADRPDRFAAWRDALQADVALIQRFLASQSGGAKALRFDMGTRCGPAVRGPPGRPPERPALAVRRQLQRDRAGGRAAARQLRRPAQRRDPGRHAQRRRLRLRARRERPRIERRPPRLEQPAQRRRLRVGAVLARRPAGARRRPARLVARGHAARDHAQPRRRPVVGPALDAARRIRLRALRPLLAGLRRHVLHGRRRRVARDALRLPARRRRDPAGLRLRPRRLLQPRASARQLPGDALERLRQRLHGTVRGHPAGVRRWDGRPRPGTAGRHGRSAAGRHRAPRLHAQRRHRQLAQRPA